MTDPNDLEAIIAGTFALLGLFGLPVAAIAAPVVQIARGILGIRNAKKQRR